MHRGVSISAMLLRVVGHELQERLTLGRADAACMPRATARRHLWIAQVTPRV